MSEKFPTSHLNELRLLRRRKFQFSQTLDSVLRSQFSLTSPFLLYSIGASDRFSASIRLSPCLETSFHRVTQSCHETWAAHFQDVVHKAPQGSRASQTNGFVACLAARKTSLVHLVSLAFDGRSSSSSFLYLRLEPQSDLRLALPVLSLYSRSSTGRRTRNRPVLLRCRRSSALTNPRLPHKHR
ncbi:hypothetical protein ASPCAL05924 [Aspergillus calidoustus]|uniref:Uncharacterized protein n=1 Tax=Aspergillus calidoustus TaxID=454130 RepID=A0A0U5G5I7_ASPCI|nr:hypothetical protein ASPCAL05924 [Aspergillus calidoustus]